MKTINEMFPEKKSRPIKVLQFGEGNFLRAFVDYMFDILNEKAGFDGNIAVIKPIEFGSVEMFEKQDSVYTVLLRGVSGGKEIVEKRVIDSVEKVIACYENYDEYAALAKLDTLRYVVSNTTEAGIVLDESDDINLCPPRTYPAKLAKFLYERYKHFGGAADKGLVILPVELIDDNGIELKRCVKALADVWKLESGFSEWLDSACVFASTLVDRIVTGYPREGADEIFEELGYKDDLLVTAEPFALWVIESNKDISGELPFNKVGLPVIFTDNQKPYKQRKVRILNGAHTSFVLASYLAGNDFVGQSMDDEIIRSFMYNTIFDEVIPTLDLPKNELEDFAASVIDRFKNPFIKHALLAISLNSVSKWRARCMPSYLGYIERCGKTPDRLAFSLAALIAFYNGSEIKDGALIGNRSGEEYLIKDDKQVLEFFAENSSKSAKEITGKFLSNEAFFGTDLTKQGDTLDKVSGYLEEIRTSGMRKALEKYFG